MAQRLKLAPQRGPLLVRLGNFVAQRGVSRKSIKQFEMRFGIEKRLLISLAVNIDKERPQITQQRVCGELIVDKDLVSPGGRNLTANYEFTARR
jgi:hypothetical protein